MKGRWILCESVCARARTYLASQNFVDDCLIEGALVDCCDEVAHGCRNDVSVQADLDSSEVLPLILGAKDVLRSQRSVHLGRS